MYPLSTPQCIGIFEGQLIRQFHVAWDAGDGQVDLDMRGLLALLPANLFYSHPHQPSRLPTPMRSLIPLFRSVEYSLSFWTDRLNRFNSLEEVDPHLLTSDVRSNDGPEKDPDRLVSPLEGDSESEDFCTNCSADVNPCYGGRRFQIEKTEQQERETRSVTRVSEAPVLDDRNQLRVIIRPDHRVTRLTSTSK